MKNYKGFLNQSFTINQEIIEVFKDYYDKFKIPYNKEKAKKFIEFLKIDFYDWIKGNLRYFE